MSRDLKSLTYVGFTNEAARRVDFGDRMKGAIIFSKIKTWLKIDDYITFYNSQNRTWTIDLVSTSEKDFYVMVFENKIEGIKSYFYLKSVKDKDYVTFLVFSYTNHEHYEVFHNFIKNNPGIWFAWLGSKFLENFEEFMRDKFEETPTNLVEFVLESRDITSKRKKGSSRHWMARNKSELQKLRRLYYDEYEELLYIKRGKFQFVHNEKHFTFSISDRSEYTIFKGGFLEFSDLLKELLYHVVTTRNLFSRKITYKKTERNVQTLQSPVISVSIDNIEVIQFEITKPFFKNWYTNLVKAFSQGYFNEYKLLSIFLEGGNPYSLIELIDLENGERLFLSVLDSLIRISPSRSSTEPSTVSKIFSLLQSRVDPTIALEVT